MKSKYKKEPINILEGSNPQQLLGYVAAIESLDNQAEQINKDKSMIYSQAKALGFDKTLVKQLVRDGHSGTLRLTLTMKMNS